MVKRRSFLTTVAASATVLAGCTEGSDSGSQPASGQNTDGSTTAEQPSTETPTETPTPTESPPDYGLPSCGSGDYVFEVISAGYGDGDFHVNFINLLATEVDVYTIGVTINPVGEERKSASGVIAGDIEGPDYLEGGERGTITIDSGAFDEYLDSEDFEDERIEEISISPLHEDEEDYDGFTCYN
ncbi:hypothetical protein QA599_21180 [Haloarculaceae archaeon H-GB1-1]|nr:hypothetical protein [Haloarculaceae archaeon H-GB1-1]